MVSKGEIWWADLEVPRGSSPGYRRPVCIIQSDSFNRSKIQTVIVAIISSNLKLANAPGNILLPMKLSGLNKDSVLNISQIITLDKSDLTDKVKTLNIQIIKSIDKSITQVLDL